MLQQAYKGEEDRIGDKGVLGGDRAGCILAPS